MIITVIFIVIGKKIDVSLIKGKNLKSIMWIQLCLIVHNILSIAFISNDYWYRMMLSTLLMFFVMWCGDLLSNLLVSINSMSFHKVLIIGYVFFVTIGFIMAYLFRIGYIQNKSMFIFKEPSHYALYFAPLIFYVMYYYENTRRVLSLIMLFILAFLLENLTLVLVLLLLVILLVLNDKVKLMKLTVIIVALSITLPYIFDLSYFIDRLSFSRYSNNLSVLVFVSGWERALLSLLDTFGFGVGFQRMGYIGNSGVAMENISTLLNGRYINLYDGGTTASKIISELGIIGILCIVAYIIIAVKVVSRYSNKSFEKSQSVFMASVYITFAIQLFVRGIGYFTPFTLFFVASLFFAYNERDTIGVKLDD